MRYVSIAALLLELGACASADHSPPIGDAESADRREAGAEGDALIQRIYEYGLGFGESRASIRESLGQPARIDIALAENRHVRSATDSLFTLVYDGLRFELNRPGPVERDLLMSVTLTDRTRSLPGGVAIGMRRAELGRVLGVPADTRSAGEESVLAYRVPGTGADQFVEFVVRTDTVRSIRWVPYVD